MNKLTQEELDNKYIEYCQTNDLKGIQNLRKKYPPSKNKIFSAFLSLIGFNKPSLDFFCKEYEGFYKLCENGSLDILSFIVSQPDFLENHKKLLANHRFHIGNDYMEANKKILHGIFLAADNGHFECADLLVPFEKELDERVPLHIAFLDACDEGNLNRVKFLINSENIFLNVKEMVNGKLTESHPAGECFVDACRNGHLDIIKYLTSDPDLDEKINLNLIEQDINIENTDIIHYLIFDLNIPKDHKLFSHIICPQQNLIEELLNKRELFEDISKDLDVNVTKSANKRPKL